MATSTQLDLLSVIYGRSPEGLGVPEDELRPLAGETYDEDVAALEAEGLVTTVDSSDGGPNSIAVTDAGRSALAAGPE